LAGTVVLIPKAPLVLITLFVQVIATTLMPAALVFLILLLNDRKTMGVYCNTLWENMVNIGIVILVIVTSTLYGISAVFPSILNDPKAAWQGVIAFFQNLSWTPGTIAVAVVSAAVAIGVGVMWRTGRWPRWSAIADFVRWIARGIRSIIAAVGGNWLAAHPLIRGLAAWIRRSRLGRFARLTREQFRAVNRKYAKPEIETTRFARFCLLSLRVYLFALIGLMVFKFIVAAL
jgi:hypothetical protein